MIFEQPEIHLHPSAQSGLADLFIEAVQAWEKATPRSRPRSLQLVVESHSEHFLRRLQRRVAEGRIAPEDVAIYYCSAGARGARIQPLPLDLFGNIANWPQDFFGDEMGDLVAMTEAAMRREAEGNL